jgi:hypothetical protein
MVFNVGGKLVEFYKGPVLVKEVYNEKTGKHEQEWAEGDRIRISTGDSSNIVDRPLSDADREEYAGHIAVANSPPAVELDAEGKPEKPHKRFFGKKG